MNRSIFLIKKNNIITSIYYGKGETACLLIFQKKLSVCYPVSILNFLEVINSLQRIQISFTQERLRGQNT